MNQGYVYIVKAEGMEMYKIGVAQVADARLKTLQAGSPVKLDLMASVYCDNARETESVIHEALAANRSHSEWFRLDNYGLRVAEKILRNPIWFTSKVARMIQATTEGIGLDEAAQNVYGVPFKQIPRQDRSAIRWNREPFEKLLPTTRLRQRSFVDARAVTQLMRFTDETQPRRA